MFGNLVGTGKMENNGGNKLYCVTINGKYTFYSSIQINDANDLRNYLEIKGSIGAFGIDGATSATAYIVDSITSIEYNTQSSYLLKGVRVSASFSSKQYQGGNVVEFSSGQTYSTTTISCVEV